MPITQIFTPAPPAPLATDVGTPAFDEKSFPFIKWFETTTGEFNNFVTQANSLESNVNTKEASATQASATATSARDEAVSARDEAVSARDEAVSAKNIIESYGITEGTALELTAMTDLVNSMDARVTQNELTTRKELYKEFDLI